MTNTKFPFVLFLILFFMACTFLKSMENKKHVLIDVAHNPVFWNDPQDMESHDFNQLDRVKYLTGQLIESISPFKADIGYIQKQIGSDDLESCDVLFIHVPKAKYSQKEIDAVRQYLDNGGSLFLVMDVDFWSSLDETNVNDLIKPFEIQFAGKSPDSLTGGYTMDGIITGKALKISYHEGRIINGGIPFCFNRQTKDYPFGVYKTLKSGGKIIVMGDGMPSLYMNSWGDVNDYQCNEFMRDVFKWLLE